MAENCKSSLPVVNISTPIKLVLSHVWKALLDTPEAEQLLLARIQSISPKAKEEYQNIKRASVPADFDKASRLLLLGKKIMSENCVSREFDDTNVVMLVFSYILEALKDTPQGEKSLLSALQRIRLASEECLNVIGAITPNFISVLESKANGCDTNITRTSRQKLETHAASACCEIVTVKNIKSNDSGNDIDLGKLFYSYDRGKLKDKPLAQERFLSRLQRIMTNAKKEYLNIKAARTRKTKALPEDKAQECDTTKSSHPSGPAISTSKKSNASFEQICEDLYPNSELPEGLLLAQSIYCAKAGLAFYNEKHGTDYVLVEPLSSGRYLGCGIYFHSNFRAKKNGSHASQVELFYADFRCFKKKVHDMHCCIIYSAEAIFHCCPDCPVDIAHCYKRSASFTLCGKVPAVVADARKNNFCAKTALDSFNEKHDTKYKLVKSRESSIVPVSFGVYKFHCNFKAKLENPSSSKDTSAKLFFGEFVKRTPISEVNCCILQTTEGLDDHCSICRQDIFHPAHYENSVNVRG